MKRPLLYNIPEGKTERDALPDGLMELMEELFPAITSVFGVNAVFFRLDIGKIYESAQAGNLEVEGQFVDQSDGELFDFLIIQEPHEVRYKSSGEYLDGDTLQQWLTDGNSTTQEGAGADTVPPNVLDLLLEATSNPESEPYASPFAEKLRKDLDYLGVIALALFRGAISVEGQALYAAMHSYTITYALHGMFRFSQAIRSQEGDPAGDLADQWLDQHGLDAATDVIKGVSALRLSKLEDQLDAGDSDRMQTINALLDEAIDMAMATARDMIQSIVSGSDYKKGDVSLALSAAIEEFCPIDNSDGYRFSPGGRQLSRLWHEVVQAADCPEALGASELGLPIDNLGAEQSTECAQTDRATPQEIEHTNDAPVDQRIYYVNVGEGASRNWDDCRRFGFLAAGGGRKWSKQLEKLQIGDRVIAYLKGYGYVGIGTVTQSSTPSSKFMINGTPIKELPLINDTIRSVKRFSTQNGEYLIGVDWDAAVPREQAAWEANTCLYTTALVCASLQNQSTTVDFAIKALDKHRSDIHIEMVKDDQVSAADSMNLSELPCPQTCDNSINWIQAVHADPDNEEELNFSSLIPESVLTSPWASDEEFLSFFRVVSIDLAQSALDDPGSSRIKVFGIEGNGELGLDSAYVQLWERAHSINDPSLQEMIDISDWGDQVVHREVGELPLKALIPLAHAYQFDSFWEQLSNGWASGDRLTATLEEFLGQMIAMMAPGYYDGEIPKEILKIGSPRILAEIFEYRDQYSDLWTPDNIRDVLNSGYADEQVKQFIAHVLEDEASDPDWESHREELWTDKEVAEVLQMCK